MKTEQMAIGRISISDTARPITPDELVYALFGISSVGELIKEIKVNKEGEIQRAILPR